jgi:protocatechuate 3,4-dioxygenase beta subunit
MRSHPTKILGAKVAGEARFLFIAGLITLLIGGLLFFATNALFFCTPVANPSPNETASNLGVNADSNDVPETAPPLTTGVTPPARPDVKSPSFPRDNYEAVTHRRPAEPKAPEEEKLVTPIITESAPLDDETEVKPDPEDTPTDDPMSSDELYSLSGWLFDESGAPVPGLSVIACTRRAMAESESGGMTTGGHERNTRSNSDGYFAFQQLVNGEYEVRTGDTERYEAARAIVRAGVDSAVLVVKEKLNRSVHVHGTVESTKGGFLKGVRVVPVGQAGQGAHTNELGDYGLNLTIKARRNDYAFRFMQEGYRTQRLTLAAKDIRDVDDVRLDAFLEPEGNQATVSGTVTGADGPPVRRARVQLYSARLERSYQTGSDRTGRFSFPSVEVATDYRLWVRPKDRYKDYLEEGLVITSGKMDLPIVLEPSGLASLEGRMVDPDGAPVPGFSLWLRTANATAQRYILVTGDQQGRFFVSELPEGELVFQTRSAPRFTVTGIALSGGVNQNVRLTLDTGSHTLDGYVLDSQDEPVPGALISLLWSHEDDGVRSRSTRQTVADANGYFLFTQLGSGLHTLNISASGFRGARVEYQVGADPEVLVKLIDELSP